MALSPTLTMVAAPGLAATSPEVSELSHYALPSSQDRPGAWFGCVLFRMPMAEGQGGRGPGDRPRTSAWDPSGKVMF